MYEREGRKGISLLEVILSIVIIGALLGLGALSITNSTTAYIDVESKARLFAENLQWARLLAMSNGHDFGDSLTPATPPYTGYEIHDCKDPTVSCWSATAVSNSNGSFVSEVGGSIVVNGLNTADQEQFFRFHEDGTCTIFSAGGAVMSQANAIRLAGFIPPDPQEQVAALAAPTLPAALEAPSIGPTTGPVGVNNHGIKVAANNPSGTPEWDVAVTPGTGRIQVVRVK